MTVVMRTTFEERHERQEGENYAEKWAKPLRQISKFHMACDMSE